MSSSPVREPLLSQVALVTGASRGIGRGIALRLAEAGADVVINYHSNAQEAEQVADGVRGLGRRALLVQCDVSDYQAVEGMVQRAVAEMGRLDIAVTNAYFSERGLFHEADLDKFRRTLDVSMWGAFYTLRAVASHLIAQGSGGAMVVISSPHAIVPVPRSMAYNMSKAAIDHMARTAAIELAEHRVRVNIVHPGWIDTPGERKYYNDEEIVQAAKALPWKRLGQPDEIGHGVVFLCDPASDYITGTTLTIDGGITLPWWTGRGSAVPE